MAMRLASYTSDPFGFETLDLISHSEGKDLLSLTEKTAISPEKN